MSELGYRIINVCKNGSELEKFESLERGFYFIDGGWYLKLCLSWL